MKRLICVVLCFCLLLSGMGTVTAADTYRVGAYDVPYDEGCAERLDRLGLFRGTGDGYALDEGVTRAQAAVMVVRMMGRENMDIADVREPFSDMRGHWAERAVRCGYHLGYINGTGADTFEPERGVTGREFVKMLLSAMGYEGVTIANAYDKGVETALLTNNFTKAAVEDEAYALNRNDMANLCSSALLVNLADGGMLKDLLIERGVFTEQAFNDTMLCSLPVPPRPRSYAWDLNLQMPEDKNYMFSPLSIKIALAMAANGAEGETRQQILDAFGIDDLDAFNAYVKELIASYAQNDKVKLQIANSIWLNRDYKFPLAANAKFTDGYAKLLADYYAAEAGLVTDADALERVNGWVSDNTNGKIKSILEKPDFLAALVNAVYFKGAWQEQFREGATKPDIFTNRDGSEAETAFMHETDYFRYYGDAQVQMVRLPYEDRDTAMYIALPSVRAIDLEQYIEKMESKRVALTIPKFKIEFDIELNDILKQMELTKAFDQDAAQFPNMIENHGFDNIFIDKVMHKTYIDVDENGTEAAAVTAVAAGGTTSVAPPPPEPIPFVADRPFTYFIYDEAHHEILFMGEYVYAE